MSCSVVLDKEGFLRNLSDWSPEVAVELAVSEGLELTESHWQILTELRGFYKETEISPAMRPFVKLVKTRVSDDLGNSITLMQLFGQSPAKTAAKVAGLPKPTNCL